MERLTKLQKWILKELNKNKDDNPEYSETQFLIMDENGDINPVTVGDLTYHPDEVYEAVQTLVAKKLIALPLQEDIINKYKEIRITDEGIEELKPFSLIKDVVYREPVAVVAIIISTIALILRIK